MGLLVVAGMEQAAFAMQPGSNASQSSQGWFDSVNVKPIAITLGIAVVAGFGLKMAYNYWKSSCQVENKNQSNESKIEANLVESNVQDQVNPAIVEKQKEATKVLVNLDRNNQIIINSYLQVDDVRVLRYILQEMQVNNNELEMLIDAFAEAKGNGKQTALNNLTDALGLERIEIKQKQPANRTKAQIMQGVKQVGVKVINTGSKIK